MNKLITLVLVAVMMMSMLVIVPSAATPTPWDGTTTTPFTGSGTIADPYIIDSAEKLAYLAAQQNAETPADYDGCYFKQTADIDLGGKEWTPIGINQSKAFYGVYDGNGYKITGFKMTQLQQFTGLFGYVIPGLCSAGIMNVTLEGDITVAECDAAHGVGSIVGWLYKDSNDLEGAYPFMTNCKSKVNFDVTATNQLRFGGLAGYAFCADIQGCTFEGTIVHKNTSTTRVGGLVGQSNRTTYLNCVNAGYINVEATGAANNVGGLVGMLTAKSFGWYTKFINCVNLGEIAVKSDKKDGHNDVGGIVGSTYVPGGLDNCLMAEFTNCYNLGNITNEMDGSAESTATPFTGGIVGKTGSYNDIKIEGCVNAGVLTAVPAATALTGGIVGSFYPAATTIDKVYIKNNTCTDAVVCGNMPETFVLDNCKVNEGLEAAKALGAAIQTEAAKGATLDVLTRLQQERIDAGLDNVGTTEPEATEPVATEPVATEPTATEPTATEPQQTTPVTQAPDTTPSEDEGCGSAIAGVIAILAVLGTAVAIKRK